MILRIAFIGSGQMAEALINGIISSKFIDPQDIVAADIDKNRLDELSQKYGVQTEINNNEAVKKSDLVVLSVKPQAAGEVLDRIKEAASQKIFMSIMAGVTSASIEKALPQARVLRVMPNTAALAGKAVSALAKGSRANDEDLETACLVLENVGKVIILDEELMDAVTALSGSGPAYYYWLTEVLTEAGTQMGLTEEQSKVLARETFTGAAALLDKTDEEPGQLRKKVTSPGGTTETALKSLELSNVSEAIINAVKAAKKRSEELSK